MNSKMKDARIKKVSAADLVCEKIKQYIKDEVWKIGDRIPAESELASIFGVNRLTVRLALQKLNAFGVLETRSGSGTYVVNFNLHDHISVVADFYMQPELLDNVCEFRKLVELECARLAIERATQTDLEELHQILQYYSDEMEKNYNMATPEAYEALAKADIAFHRQICKMSHNKLYQYSFAVAEQSIFQYVLILIKQRGEKWSAGDSPSIELLRSKDRHRAIYEAIKEGNFELCKKYYVDMVDHTSMW